MKAYVLPGSNIHAIFRSHRFPITYQLVLEMQYSRVEDGPMLHYAWVFLIVALVAAFLGFGGIAGTAAGIAKILFVVFLVMFLVSFITGRRSV